MGKFRQTKEFFYFNANSLFEKKRKEGKKKEQFIFCFY